MEMKRKKISVTSLILPVIMLVVAVVLPMIYSTNYYIQLFSQTLINLVAVLGLNVVMGLAGQTNLGTIALVAVSYTHLDVYKRQRQNFVSSHKNILSEIPRVVNDFVVIQSVDIQ